MTQSSDDNYVEKFGKYLKHNESPDDLRKIISTHATSTKLVKPFIRDPECKICKVLSKPEDLCRVLNQGLYHKYTSSQDYFYTRDINSLLLKKKKPFCIKFYDEQIFDECKERLKGYFRKKDAASLMIEIKNFYSKFQSFPRNFQPHFYSIINSNIRKHRRLEYIKVFHNVDFEDPEKQENGSDKDNKKLPTDSARFDFMEMLGESFLQDNYRDISNFFLSGLKLGSERDVENSLREVGTNFKALYKLPKNAINDPTSAPFSNALYNKNYMLYSRRDSTTAEDILKQIVNEFREVDFSRKSSVSLAEKVMNQAKPSQYSPKKINTRNSPNLKARKTPSSTTSTITGLTLGDSSPTLQSRKGPLTNNNLSIIANLQLLQKQQSQPSNSTKRGSSNMKNTSQLEVESATTPGKGSQGRLFDPRKTQTKISIESINDLALNRNSIASKLYQFRSTRSKSGGLKTLTTTSKTPLTRPHQPQRYHTEIQTLDTSDNKHALTAYYINYKSKSPSPERLITREDLGKPLVEMRVPSKPSLESPYHAVKRSISSGLNDDHKDTNHSSSSIRKKSNSVIKRATATPKKHHPNPSMHILTTNNISSGHLITNSSNQETHSTPNGKFINPARTTSTGNNSQAYYFRHRIGVGDKSNPDVEGYSPIVGGNKTTVPNLRASKDSTSKRVDHYRVATMSLSGRHHNFSDMAQNISSLGSQSSLLLNKTQQSQPQKRKKVGPNEAQNFAAKIMKRSSAVPNQISDPMEEVVESKSKKALELTEGKYNSFKNAKSPSQDQIIHQNLYTSIATSTNRLKAEIKKSILGPYTVKASTKDIKFGIKK